MVKVDKGDWDKSRGWEWNHEFNGMAQALPANSQEALLNIDADYH